MSFRAVSILLLLPLFAADGDKDGRRGNDLYNKEQYDLAVEAYYAGIAALKDSDKPWLRYALQNNLGAALLKSGDAAAAREAFARAIASAPSPGDQARTEYNAGNAAFEARDLQQALNQYRQSLLKNPNNPDAKFNYEYVKRQLEQQQNQQQQQQNQQNQDKGDQEQQSRNEGDQNQEQQEDQEQKSDQQNQDGEEQQSDQPQEQDERQPPQEQEGKLSQQQAERILEALENEEEQLLRQVQRMKAKPRRVEKDW